MSLSVMQSLVETKLLFFIQKTRSWSYSNQKARSWERPGLSLSVMKIQVQ